MKSTLKDYSFPGRIEAHFHKATGKHIQIVLAGKGVAVLFDDGDRVLKKRFRYWTPLVGYVFELKRKVRAETK